MASVKVGQFIIHLSVAAVLLSSTHCAAQSSSSAPTPDPYFKPVPKKPDFSDTYVPPDFSPGSIGKLPKKTTTNSHSVPWSHQRSIVRDATELSNDFRPQSGIVDSPDKIQLATAIEPIVQQEGSSTRSNGSSTRAAGSSTKPNGSTTKAGGSSTKANGSSTKANGSSTKPNGSTTKSDGSATKTDGSTTKVEQLQQFEPSRVVALVGGEPLFVGDMLFEANQLIEAKIPQAPESAKQVQRKRILKAMTRKFVDQKLLFVDAMAKLPAEANVDNLIEQATGIFNEQVLPQMMESSGVTNVAEFDGNLRVQGSSLRQVRLAWAKDQLARQFVQQDLKVNQAVAHQEMLEVYLANKEKYAVRARSKWEQIMVRFDKHDSRAAAKKKIAELGNQIIHGANLAAVAKKQSDGFRAAQGGQHDFTGKGALVLKEIDEAIFTLPVNKLSDIIESRDGYHIVRVLERNDASYTPFTEAQIEIRKKIKNDRFNSAFEHHLESVRARIPVEYFPLE